MGSVWRIAAKLICHAASSFPSFSSGSSQGRAVLDIILATGEDLGAMATMVVQATIQGMEAIMEGAVQITTGTMVAQAITPVGVAITMVVDPTTMEAQAITLADLTT